MSKRHKKNIFEQFACMVHDWADYIHDQPDHDFMGDLVTFINNQEEVDYSGDRLQDYVILNPVLLDSSKKKAIVMILSRDIDLKGEKVEKVRFISGKNENISWYFKEVKGYIRRFIYKGQEFTISEHEMFMRIFFNLLEAGYLKEGTCEVNDSFFENDRRYSFDKE